MIVMESMPSQWASLVETNQMYTALRWCEREWSRGFVPPTTLQLMEEELRYRAGFQLLYSGRIREGMDFLEGATRLDVRELCRLVPECLPVVKDSGGPNPGRYDDHHPWPTTTESSRGVHHCDGRPVSNGKGKGDAAKVVHFLPAEPETDYWAEWHPTPFNAHPDRLEASWCEGYRSRQRRGLQNESSTASGPLSTTTNKPASLYAFLEDCWCELKERVEAMLQKYSADQDRHHDALCPAQSRAAAYALLVLALERRDWSAAHACCLSPHLFLSDVHDLLSSLGEYRLLACVLWRAGYYSEADRLMQSRLYLSGLLSQAHHVVQGRSNALETDNSDVSKKLPLCVTAELTCPVFVKKNSGISTNTTASECSAVPQRPAPQEPSPLVRVGAVGVGWLALPQKLRELTAVHLLGLFDSFDDAVDNSYCSGFCSSSPSTTAVNHTNLAHGNTTDSSHSYVNGSAADTRATKRENHRVELEDDRIHCRTELAVEDWWIHRVAARNQHRQQQALATLKALEERVTVSEALWGGGGNQRDAACSVFSSNPVGERRDALSANERNRGRLPLPSTLALELLLLDHVDLDALRLRFAEDPSRVCLIDGEGSGLLLLVFGLLLQRGRAHRRDPSADSSSEVEDSLRECLREAVMCAVECLLDAGCPTDCINVHGWSCLDILTVADPFHADEFVAALLSVKDVSACLNEEERG